MDANNAIVVYQDGLNAIFKDQNTREERKKSLQSVLINLKSYANDVCYMLSKPPKPPSSSSRMRIIKQVTTPYKGVLEVGFIDYELSTVDTLLLGANFENSKYTFGTYPQIQVSKHNVVPGVLDRYEIKNIPIHTLIANHRGIRIARDVSSFVGFGNGVAGKLNQYIDASENKVYFIIRPYRYTNDVYMVEFILNTLNESLQFAIDMLNNVVSMLEIFVKNRKTEIPKFQKLFVQIMPMDNTFGNEEIHKDVEAYVNGSFKDRLKTANILSDGFDIKFEVHS
jgi:hypothetical protein